MNTTRRRQPKLYTHGRKLVMTRDERNTYLGDVAYYEREGYPEAVAKQRAMDHYHAAKKPVSSFV